MFTLFIGIFRFVPYIYRVSQKKSVLTLCNDLCSQYLRHIGNKYISEIFMISAFHGIFYFHSTPFRSLAVVSQRTSLLTKPAVIFLVYLRGQTYFKIHDLHFLKLWLQFLSNLDEIFTQYQQYMCAVLELQILNTLCKKKLSWINIIFRIVFQKNKKW